MSSKHSILDFRFTDFGFVRTELHELERSSSQRKFNKILLQPAPKNSTAAKIRTNRCLKVWPDEYI